MFDDEHDQNAREESYSSSNKDALTNNSAVKAAIFVFGLIVCIVIIYVLILKNGIAAPVETTPTPDIIDTTADPNATPDDTTPAPNPDPDPIQTETPFSFSKGSSDPKVKEIQQLLINKKYLSATTELSENFGEKTDAAVKDFQKSNGLPETGVVDNDLFNRLTTAPEKETPFSFKKGDDNAKIKEIQDLLISKGYLNLEGEPSTTYFGAKTEQSVKDFQKSLSRTETGVVDNELFNQLKNAPPKS